MANPPFQKPKITAAFKKKILKDWQTCLPGLTIDPPLCLTRRVGPLLIFVGFEVKSGRENYYPEFGVHNLSYPRDFLASILNEPLRTLRTNAPDSLTVRAHEKGDYVEAAERMKAQALLPFEGPISLSMIIEAYQQYAIKMPALCSASTFRDPALIAAWAGKEELAREMVEWGLTGISQWSKDSQERLGGLHGWYKDMEARISDPQKLRQIVEEQVIFHKLTHIPGEELIID